MRGDRQVTGYAGPKRTKSQNAVPGELRLEYAGAEGERSRGIAGCLKE